MDVSGHGLVRVPGGEVYEERDGSRFRHVEGSVVAETPGTIHVMGNDSSQEAHTLHMYTPELNMGFHDEEQ
jgi:hypothetical protein